MVPTFGTSSEAAAGVQKIFTCTNQFNIEKTSNHIGKWNLCGLKSTSKIAIVEEMERLKMNIFILAL